MTTINELPEDEFNFINVGQTIPDFSWSDDSGKIYSSEMLKGKKTLVILFSYICQHCVANFQYLEEKLFSSDLSHLNLLIVARECSEDHIETYCKKYSLTIKPVADVDRVIYSKFAEKVVPRLYFFDSSGDLLISVRGYKPRALDELIKVLKA